MCMGLCFVVEFSCCRMDIAILTALVIMAMKWRLVKEFNKQSMKAWLHER